MDLTPADMQIVMEAYAAREEREMEKLAWLASNIMNCWSKKKVTPKKLLGSRSENLVGQSKESILNKARALKGGK